MADVEKVSDRPLLELTDVNCRRKLNTDPSVATEI